MNTPFTPVNHVYPAYLYENNSAKTHDNSAKNAINSANSSDNSAKNAINSANLGDNSAKNHINSANLQRPQLAHIIQDSKIVNLSPLQFHNSTQSTTFQ